MKATKRVCFFVNGAPRLLMAAVIAEELYRGAEKHIILLDQFGYDYDSLLPLIVDDFTVHRLAVRTRNYSHVDQVLSCYFSRFRSIRNTFRAETDMILFGLRSPSQKFIIRRNKKLGNRVLIFAESLAVDRYFSERPPEGLIARSVRRLFSRAFEYQHDYDVFYLFCKAVYADAPFSEKTEQMFDLFGSDSFRRYAAKLTRHVDVEALRRFDTVLLGQPLSNFDGTLDRAEEERVLRSIIGDKAALVLPHPNEILGPDNKYGVLPNASVLEAKVPSDLILAQVRPKETITYSSTIGITYAMSNREATSRFYPVFQTHVDMLRRYRAHIPNVQVDESFVTAQDPYG